MAVKSSTYINAELEWAEQQLVTWKAYVDANPLHELTDRVKYKETRNGGAIPMVVASIEAQGKFIQDTMKNYLSLLEQVDKLREKEEAKKVPVRGGVELGSMADDYLKKRNKE
jgi:hypothetical protein